MIVVLPAPDGPTRAVSRLSRSGEAHVVQDVLPRVGALRRGQGDRLQRGQRHLGGRRIAERDMVEDDLGGRSGRRRRAAVALLRERERHRVGPVLDQRLEVEYLEHAVKADQRRHQIDLNIGQCGDGPVKPIEQEREGNQRADLKRAVHDQAAAYPVNHRRRQRREQRQRDEQRTAVHRLDDADIPDLGRPAGEEVGLLARPAEELRQHRAGDVEALGHRRAHSGVELHRLPRQPLQLAPDQPGGNDEQRYQGQRDDRDQPGEVEHRAQYEDQLQRARHRRDQRRRQRLLRADHIAVQPAD